MTGPVDLAVCCFDTLQYLQPGEDLRFAAVGGRSRRKGVFAFDIYQPNLDYLRTPGTIASPGL